MKLVVVLGVVAMVVGAGSAHADATGQVRFKGADFKVADAVAYQGDDGVEVALLSTAFDRAAAGKDQKIDTFDVMRTRGANLTLKVGRDGGLGCIDYSPGNGGGSACNGDFAKGLKLTANTADRIAGTFRLKSGADVVDVAFDLKVESTVARAGTALPPDGGEPGKAVLAHFAALEKGDFKALKATAPPEQRAMMDASEKSGEAKEMFQLLRDISPRKVRLTGGTVDGDRAFVDFEGTADGQVVKGVADVVRLDGKWYFKGTSMR